MVIRIGSNISSLAAQRKLAETTNALSRTFERLSTGQRINRAFDDAAGLAIAQKLSTDSRIYSQAIRNVNDGLSYLNIADAALSELSDITSRQLELAEQAANGVYTFAQRKALAAEANALVKEFNRIIQSTQFNGQRVVDAESSGPVRIQAGYGENGGLAMGVGDELSRAAGTGDFYEGVSYVADDPESFDVVLGDINADGAADLITTGLSQTATGQTTIRLNDGSGNFQSAVALTEDFYSNNVALADLDGDGALDLITAGYSANAIVTIRLNNGQGSFGAAVSYTGGGTTYSPASLAIADLNGDGFVDLASGSYDSILIWYNDGSGDFSTGTTVSSTWGTVNDLAIKDMNGDGRPDLITAEYFGMGRNAVSVMINDGSGNFSSGFSTTASGGVAFSAVSAADLNADGVSDLIVAGRNGADGQIWIRLNEGSGTFDSAVSYSSNCNLSYGLALGDLNGDGAIDLLTTGDGLTAGSTTIRLNDGSGNFGGAKSFASASPVNRAISLGDIDRDGVLDVATVGDLANPGEATVLKAVAQRVTTIATLDLHSQEDAGNALATLKSQLDRIGSERGGIGGYQSRLSVALNTLYSSRENAAAAASRITDIDVAQESAELARNQILQQAGSAILAQANQQPALALQLLKV